VSESGPEAVGIYAYRLLAGPDRTEHHSEGIVGWPSRQCPIAHACSKGSSPSRVHNNVGLGLITAEKSLQKTFIVERFDNAVVIKFFRVGAARAFPSR
jgi:hypothetical protein